jgi:hypothetical protein
MITFVLVVYLTTGAFTVGGTDKPSVCKAWENYSEFNICLELQTL